MTGITPLLRLWSESVRKLHILYWKWARHDMPHTLGVQHPDMNRVVLRIAELEPPPKRRSRCADVPGLCAMDPECPDIHCPGRWRGVHHKDGGMQVEGAVSFPIDPPPPPEPTRIAIALPDLITASCVLALVACTPLLLF